MKRKSLLPLPMLLMISATPYAADDSTGLMIDAGPCLDITRAIERLQCFEDQVSAAQGQEPVKDAAGASSETAARAAPVPDENLPRISIPRSGNRTATVTDEDNARQSAEEPQGTQEADKTDEDNFGLVSRSELRKNKNGESELVAIVAEIKELNPNRMLITLENGQVWEQKETERFALSEGDEIRINQHRWGSSYRLSATKHSGFILVERLK